MWVDKVRNVTELSRIPSGESQIHELRKSLTHSSFSSQFLLNNNTHSPKNFSSWNKHHALSANKPSDRYFFQNGQFCEKKSDKHIKFCLIE